MDTGVYHSTVLIEAAKGFRPQMYMHIHIKGQSASAKVYGEWRIPV